MSRRINETWLIVAGLGLLCAMAWWLISTYKQGQASYQPMSTYSPRPEGAKALFELSHYAGLDPQRFYDTEYDYPHQACVVVLDKPANPATALVAKRLDVRALRLWLEDGGRLVLFSEPLGVVGPELFAEIDRGAGLKPYGGSIFDWNPSAPELQPPAGHGLSPSMAGSPTQEVPKFKVDSSVVASWSSVSRQSGSAGALWRLYKTGNRYALPDQRPVFWSTVDTFETAPGDMMPYVRGDVLLAADDPTWPVVIYRRVGAGEVFWITRPELAANGWIARADNHRLDLAILTQAAAGGALYFDEHIHGYTHRGPGATWLLFHTTGGHLLLALAVGLIVLFMGAAVRPARFLPQPRPPRRQAAEMVLAQADLYRRAGSSGQAAFHLLEGVRRELSAPGGGTGMDRQALAAALGGMLDRVDLNRRDVNLVREHLEGRRSAKAAELVQLARACDAIRWALRRHPS